MRALARLGGFRRLLAVRLSSQFGDGLFQASLASSVLFNPAQQTGAMKIAAGFALLVIPFSLVGPFAGVFLDRWSRRNVMVLANLVRFGIALPAALSMYANGPTALFFIGVMLVTASNRFFLAGLSAATPHVAPDQRLVTANSISSTLGTAAYSLGLGAAALGLNTVLRSGNHGYGWCAIAGSLGYLAAALIARVAFPRAALGPDAGIVAPGSVWREIAVVTRGMAAGAGHLVSQRPVAYVMLTQSLCRTLYGVLTLATLLLYSRYFFDSYGAAISGLGAVVVVGSLGAVLAAFVTPLATRKIGGRWWVVSMTALIAVTLPTLALPFQPALLVIATFLLNVASQGTKIVVDTSVQRLCAENFRGRVFSVNDTVFNAFWVLGLFLGAATLPPNGKSPGGVVAVTAGYVVVAAWYAIAARRLQPVDPAAEPEPTTALAA